VRPNWLPQRHAAPATRGRAGGANGGGAATKPQARPNQESESTEESDRARVPESESKEESDWLWTQESESTEEPDRVWTQEPESTEESDFFYPGVRVHGRVRFRWTWESGSKKSDSVCFLP
jgi:hypothetical protein